MQQIASDKSNWRLQEQFICKFGKALGCFNGVEIYETLASTVFDLMKHNSEKVKEAASFFIANMINIQYKHKIKEEIA